MTFLEIIEKEKEIFIKKESKKYNKKVVLETEDLKKYWQSLPEKEKKEYENDKAYLPFILNYLEDKLGITFENYESTLEDYLILDDKK